jgi:hypothetical protein
MRGLNNQNVEILKKEFKIESLQIVPDHALAENRLIVSE